MDSASRTARTWIGRLLLGVLGLYLMWGLAGTAVLLSMAASAEKDLAASLPDAEREADRARAQVRSNMQSLAGEKPPRRHDPRPVAVASYSWREVRCEIRPTEFDGWFAADFEQACDLVDVYLYPTSLPAAGSPDRCRPVSTESLLAEVERWPNDPGLTLWQPPASISVDAATGRQLQGDPQLNGWSCPTDVMAPPRSQESVLLVGRRPEELPSDSSWVVVRRTDQVSRSGLGCHPWLPVLCSSPLRRPWMPDV